MEIRRARRRRRMRPQLTSLGRTVLILLSGLAVLLTFLFSRTGQWISREVFMPLFSQKSAVAETDAIDAVNPTPQGDKAEVSSVTFPAIECYALQMGVYSDYENAIRSADELRAHGAAGYIRSDGAQYRVLAAGYESEDDLDSVRENLTAGGYQSAAYKLEIPKRILSVTGESGIVDRYADGLLFLPKLTGKLYDLAIRFDGEAIALEKGREELALLEDETKQYQDTFAGAADAEASFDVEIQSVYEELIHEMDDILSGPAESRASFSAGIKWLRLWLCDKLSHALRAE